MERLRALLRQIYFEDNAAVGRRASRVFSLVRKASSLVPHLVAFTHFNFGSAFPASPSRTLHPRPSSPAPRTALGVGRRDEFAREVTLFEGWSDPQGELGLPFSDDSFLAIEVGDVLGHVPDAVFALKELYRVAAPGARESASPAPFLFVATPCLAISRCDLAA